MKKIAVIYWSASGNTEAMAHAIGNGITQKGAEAQVSHVKDFSPADLANYQAVIFGCPAMGAEELEESEFEPCFAACESQLSGMPVGLFGSYGWGSGEWMASWQERTEADGAKVIGTVIAQNSPDDEAIAACAQLGAAVAAAL